MPGHLITRPRGRVIFTVLMPCLAAFALLAPRTAEAGEPIETLIGSVSSTDANDMVWVELRFLDIGNTPASITLPDRIAAIIETTGKMDTVWLERSTDTPTSLTIAPGSFVRGRYRLAASTIPEGAVLSIPQWRTSRIAFASPLARVAETAPALAAPQSTSASQQPPAAVIEGKPSSSTRPTPTDRSVGNAFVDNLGPYEPIYAVYGPGTNTAARIQFSFEYRIFGSHHGEDLPVSWRDGLHFAYTQRMFWDLRARSMPFRNIDYQPEIIYVTPAKQLNNGISLALQGGIRHESNGRDGDNSRSVNTIYAAPMAAVPLGGAWRLLVAPRLSFYVGDTSDNPDIIHYRGNTSLFLQVGDPNGLRVSTNTRFNFASGKGAVNAEVSYPLPRLLGGGPDLYLFAQGFAGYGENLLDYNRSISRLRIGFALVR